MKPGIEEMRQVLADRTAELIKDGINIKYAGYTALTDVIKDLFCASQGIDVWPEEIKLRGDRVDDFHDWAVGIAENMYIDL